MRVAPTAPTNKRIAALESVAERVARAIAMDRKIRVVLSNRSAYDFETKTLYLTQFSTDGADPRLAAAHRGQLDHELGHVVLTDFDAWERARKEWMAKYGPEFIGKLHALTNVYEDLWIEQKYADRFRGAREHLRVKNDYVVEHNGGAAACDPNYVSPLDPTRTPVGMFGALAQAIIRVTRGNVKREQCPEVIRNLLDLLAPEITLGNNASSTGEAILAAERTWEKIKELATPPPPPPPAPAEGEDDESDEGSPAPSGAEDGSGTPAPGEDGTAGDEGEEGEDTEPAEGEDDAAGDEDGEEEEGAEGEEDGGGAAGEAEEEGADSEAEEEGEGSTSEDGAAEGGTAEDEDEEGAELGEGASGSEPNAEGGGTATQPEIAPDVAAQLITGPWREVPTDAEVIANAFLRDTPPAYTIHPEAQRKDRVKAYSRRERDEGRAMLNALEEAAGPYAKKLQSYLVGAFAASRQTLAVGGLDDGEDLDADALPGIALRHRDRNVFTTNVRHIEESAFVTILVDCSGSMGRSGVNEKGGLSTKAAYAAVTACALHKALVGCRVPHGVLGYTTTTFGRSGPANARMPNGYMEWSRSSSGLEIHEFVPAPGVHDDGAALPYITGRYNNLDGESVLHAAKYAAKHGGQHDRVILFVIADGLPAGADDGRIESAYLKQVVEQVAHANIEVYGIGVGIGEWPVFASFYPDVPSRPGRAPTGSLEIRSGEGLTDAVLRRVTQLLTRGYGLTRRGR